MRMYVVAFIGLFLITACDNEKKTEKTVSAQAESSALAKSQPVTTVKFNDREQIAALAFVSYAGDFLTQSDSQVDQILETCISEELSRQPVLDNRFSLVWGPSVFRFQDDGLDDNMMYVVNDTQEDGHIIIGIRGTNGGAALDWIIEDFYVNQTKSWPYAKPFDENVRISEGTFIGLSALQNMTGAVGESSTKLALLDYLILRLNSGSLSKITVTGHSLGGALAPTFALWLKDTESHWNNSSASIPINVLPIAGATPGNADFARYYDSRLGDVTDRLHNPFDVVPHAWHIESMKKLDTLYEQEGFNIRPGLKIIGAFDIGMELAGDKNYLQIKNDQPALPGVINPNAKDSSGAINYLGQMIWQHSCGYYNALGITESMYAVNKSCHSKRYCEQNPTNAECIKMQKPRCTAVPIP